MFNSNVDSNLLQKNNTAEVDTSIEKVSIIAVLGILTATASSYFIDIIYKKPDANSFILAAVSVFIFIIIFFLQSLFVKSKSFNMLIALGETLGLASFLLLKNYSLILLIATGLTYLALYASIRKSRSELKNQLAIKINKIAKFSVPKIITAVVILISAVYSQPFFPENINISKSLIKNILSPSELIVKIADNYMKLGLKNFSIDMTIAQIAKENGLQTEILESSIQGAGLTIKSDESILDGVYNFVNEKIKNFNKTVRWAIFGSIFLLIFLTLKSFFWMFYWLIYLFIYLSYEILMALGFCKLTYEQISKEIIIL